MEDLKYPRIPGFIPRYDAFVFAAVMRDAYVSARRAQGDEECYGDVLF